MLVDFGFSRRCYVMVTNQYNVASARQSEWLTEPVRPLTDANFRRLAAFVFAQCGIRLTEQKQTMVDSRLRRRLRVIGLTDINAYCERLMENDPAFAASELEFFINAITTNKTDFFREVAHFWFLRDTLFPRFVQERRHQLSFWSAACSIGAEPYTMAMLLDEFQQSHPDTAYSVVATDISTEVLGKAVAGCYPMTMLEEVPQAYRSRYVMMPRQASRGEFRIIPSLRAKVAFMRMNLMDRHFPMSANFDVIFCRNTLIYFDRETQEGVIRRLCSHLRPGGHLFLGHSESITGFDLPLKTVGNSIFERQ